MKRLIGIFMVQAVLTSVFLYALNDISNSIKEAAVHNESEGLTLSWSDNLSFTTYAILVIVGIVGIYLTIAKEKITDHK